MGTAEVLDPQLKVLSAYSSITNQRALLAVLSGRNGLLEANLGLMKLSLASCFFVFLRWQS